MVRQLVALALVILCASGADAPAPPDANALFEKVAKTADANAYPRYASYLVQVAFHHDTSARIAETWETTQDLARGVVRSATFSLEEQQNPYVPHGSVINIPLLSALSSAASHQKENDPVGPVAFAVDQRFGLVRHVPYRITSDDKTINDASKEPPIIGRTSVVDRLYDAQWVDSDGNIDHIKLTPFEDPQKNRLREIWFDHTTFQLQTAVVAGIGDRPPMNKIYWQIDYFQKDGGTYIADELALSDVDYGKDGLLEDMIITFAGLRLSTFSPLVTSFGMGTAVDRVHDP